MKQIFMLQTVKQIMGVINFVKKENKGDISSIIWLSCVNVNTNSNEKDGYEAEEDDCMDQYRQRTCLHIPKLNNSVPPWQLD